MYVHPALDQSASKLQGWSTICLQVASTMNRACRVLMAADKACSCSMQSTSANAAALRMQTHFRGCSHLCRSQVQFEPQTHPGVA